MGRGFVTAVQTSSDDILNNPRLMGKEGMDARSVVEVESVGLVNLFHLTVDLRQLGVEGGSEIF